MTCHNVGEGVGAVGLLAGSGRPPCLPASIGGTMAQLSPRQLRNQKGQTALPKPGPGPVPSDCLAEVQAAMGAAGRDNAARQADAAKWMDHGPTSPTVSGDRQPTKASHSAHVGPVLGMGTHPGANPPGVAAVERQPDRLSPMPPPPAPVAASTIRPALSTGWWWASDSAPSARPGPLYVSAGGPARRSGGLLARLAR